MAELDGITLPDDLFWTDEYSAAWSPVAQTVQHTASGALEIEASQLQAGRPITLQGGVDHAWIDRQTVAALYATTEDPAKTMTLSLADSRQFTVRWRHHEQPPLEAHPIQPVDIPDDSDPYQVKLKLMEI
ncbi:MAG: hypothetical protein HQL52_03925 [Magnetococcales bacterium]|nr:hypothetical protein [Magnetococcales bacterium]